MTITAVAQWGVQAGSVQYATLIIGANDVSANLPAIFAGNPTPFVTEVVANIETALKSQEATFANVVEFTRTPWERPSQSRRSAESHRERIAVVGAL